MLFRAKLTILGLAEGALAVALWRWGPVDEPVRWSDPVGWLRTTTVEHALIEVGRLVIVALVAWMVLATALAIVARVVDRIRGTTRWFTVVSAVVPGFVTTMVATAIVTTAPVLAQSRAPIAPIGPVRDGRAPATATPVVAPPPDPAPVAPPVSTVHVVADGESLWSIARERVGAGADSAALADYWRALCDVNRAALRSGDVNLIHPGETLRLP
jgi:nucleoid-associated protein YgaU